MAIYVDDLLIDCAVKQMMSNNFIITLQHYLGIEMKREGETGAITICHSQYILEMIKKYGMENNKDIATPVEANY